MRLIAVLMLSVALSLSGFNPAPALAGALEPPPGGSCPEGTYGPVSLIVLQTYMEEFPRARGDFRRASAADVNHNGSVCFVPLAQGRSGRFIDDIPLLVGE